LYKATTRQDVLWDMKIKDTYFVILAEAQRSGRILNASLCGNQDPSAALRFGQDDSIELTGQQ